MQLDHAFFLPPQFTGDIQIFRPTSGTNLVGFQQWRKPKGATMITMITIAGGGGGGGGFTRTAGTAGGGGGGGACSGITRFMCPALLLPDELYVQVGTGGQGGAPSGNGGAGLNSYVLTSKTAVLPNIVCYSGVNAPGGGGAGTGAAVGGAGTVPTIAVTQPWNSLGFWFSQVGLVGVAGGAIAGGAGTSVTAWAALPLSPGAGGAGCTTTDFAGGGQTVTALLDITSQGYYPTGAGNLIKGGTAAGTGVDGGGGVRQERLGAFLASGGSGGGSNNSGVAGNGGDGGIGCGGGGGGAGATGGRGGNGGDGIVIIISN